ncbi:MAG TPA: LysE family translocator [Roseiarcus sp.]|nr:LysE family translocator [Roseiarcus sp.]
MTYAASLWIFFILLFGIIIVPGMDMLFVLANALTGGRRMGLFATAGIMAGGAYHTFLGVLGVGVLLKLAPSLFLILLLAGAAYMAWIGVTLVQSSIVVGPIGAAKSRSPRVAFRQGAITCMLNPKAYLFTLAVYPQFISPAFGPLLAQALILGAMTVLTQLGIYGSVALAAGAGRDFLQSHPNAIILIGRAAGALFIVAAAFTAWHGWTTWPPAS